MSSFRLSSVGTLRSSAMAAFSSAFAAAACPVTAKGRAASAPSQLVVAPVRIVQIGVQQQARMALSGSCRLEVSEALPLLCGSACIEAVARK